MSPEGQPSHTIPHSDHAVKQPDPHAGFFASFTTFLHRKIQGSSLAIFRILFGILMLLESVALFRPSESTSGKVMLDVYYTGPNIVMHFPYPGFEWLPWLSPLGIKTLVVIMGICGLCMALGFLYRCATIGVFLTWGYLYAVESTRTYWMSYYYLELLVCFLLIWMPAANSWSIDARFRKNAPRDSTIPFWPILLLRAQLIIMYFYAGVAKLTSDWMMDAQPVRYFLSQPHVSATFAKFLSKAQMEKVDNFIQSDGLAYFLSHTGAVFDLLVGGLLIVRRTRLFGLVLIVMFHGINHSILFDDILWFPILGIASSLIFLEPDWPMRFMEWLKRPHFRKPETKWAFLGGILIPVLGVTLGWKGRKSEIQNLNSIAARPRKRVAFFVLGWVLWQGLFPLRHYSIPGDARITFEGLSWSWRLKAEVYRTTPCEIRLQDDAFLSKDDQGHTMVHWDQWKTARVLYRSLDVESIDWTMMPEVMVLSEPMAGERILFNPAASPSVVDVTSSAHIATRIKSLWNGMYGHLPKQARPLVPLNDILDDYTTILKEKGYSPRNRQETFAFLRKFNGPTGNQQILKRLRGMHPFALEGGESPKTPLYLIDDPERYIKTEDQPPKIDRERWVAAPCTQSRHENGTIVSADNKSFLTLHIRTPDLSTRRNIPRACLMQHSNGKLLEAPLVSWDYLQDITMSKAMHISTSPFLLQRYAVRAAKLWEEETGRRPKVFADTQLSMNFRPYQQIVDPTVDLTSVKVSHWTHNSWIRDLEVKRIPEDLARTRWTP